MVKVFEQLYLPTVDRPVISIFILFITTAVSSGKKVGLALPKKKKTTKPIIKIENLVFIFFILERDCSFEH
ncbi:hypothetical protein D3C72_901050 [compost metagenome]